MNIIVLILKKYLKNLGISYILFFTLIPLLIISFSLTRDVASSRNELSLITSKVSRVEHIVGKDKNYYLIYLEKNHFVLQVCAPVVNRNKFDITQFQIDAYDKKYEIDFLYLNNNKDPKWIYGIEKKDKIYLNYKDTILIEKNEKNFMIGFAEYVFIIGLVIGLFKYNKKSRTS